MNALDTSSRDALADILASAMTGASGQGFQTIAPDTPADAPNEPVAATFSFRAADRACLGDVARLWWAAVPTQYWPRHPDWLSRLQDHWSPIWCNQRQELMFLGRRYDEDRIRQTLGACLNGSPLRCERPFPNWQIGHAA